VAKTRKRAWSQAVEKEVVAWLIEEDNPSIHYLTLTQLLGVFPKSPATIDTREKIPNWPPVRRILEHQNNDGGWDRGKTWYLPKYKSTVWQLIVLSQTGIDPRLPEIRRMCDYSFRFQMPTGGFVSGMVDDPEEDWGRLAGCLNGNVIAALCRLGLGKDQHSCFMGTICALDALIECSLSFRDTGVNEAKMKACEFLLMHRLLRADHHDWKFIRPEWAQLRAPWMVNYNLLRILRAITRAGIMNDPRMEEGIEILRSKRHKNGRWRREVSWPSSAYSSFGRAGKDDKWITLNALLVLKAVAGKQ
jgi:hypothetical protein